MKDAQLLLMIAVIVASVLASTTVFAAGWLIGRKRAIRDLKIEICHFNSFVDQKIAATKKVRG